MDGLNIVAWATSTFLDLVYNIYAFGQVDFSGSVDFLNPKEVKLESKMRLGLGIELGMKAGLTSKKVEFEGDKVTTEGKPDVTATGETYLEITGVAAIDNNGLYLQPKVNFGGVVIKVVAKAGRGSFNFQSSWQIIKAEPDIIKIDKIYIIQ